MVVNDGAELLELLVAAQTGGQLKRGDSFGCPCVADSVLAESVLAYEWQHIIGFGWAESLSMHS